MCYCFQLRLLFNWHNFQKSLKVSIQEDGSNPGIFINRPPLLLFSFAFPFTAPPHCPSDPCWSLLTPEQSWFRFLWAQETATSLLQLICPELKDPLGKSWEHKLNILTAYPGLFASWEKNPRLSFRPTGQYISKIALVHSGKPNQNKTVASCFLLSSLSSSRWNSG